MGIIKASANLESTSSMKQEVPQEIEHNGTRLLFENNILHTVVQEGNSVDVKKLADALAQVGLVIINAQSVLNSIQQTKEALGNGSKE